MTRHEAERGTTDEQEHQAKRDEARADVHPEMDRAKAEVEALVARLASADAELTPDDSIDDVSEVAAGEPVRIRTTAEVVRDRDALAAALSRLARLHGVNVPGEHVADIDTTGLSPEYVGLVEWAKTARVA